MTSSDVLDTTLAVQLTRASDILKADLNALCDALKAKAKTHKYTPTIGRSHGIHAEPTSFGLKLAGFYAEFDRCRHRLAAAQRKLPPAPYLGLSAHLPILTLLLKRMLLKRWG